MEPEDYLNFDCEIAVVNGAVAGFAVSRRIDDQERELLNVAVHPELRRSGIASKLIRSAIRAGLVLISWKYGSRTGRPGVVSEAGVQGGRDSAGYYDNPPEAAIVMRIYS